MYLQLLSVLALAALAVLALRVLARLVAVAATPFLVEPWLSGNLPTEHALSRFHARWYAASVVFLAFDVEMLFMYPWAVVVGRLGVGAVVEMFGFLGRPAAGRAVGAPGGSLPMGLTDLLARVAASRAHVLVVEAPGWPSVTGWPWSASWTGSAGAPPRAGRRGRARVVGGAGAGARRRLDRTWDQMPEPRVRLVVRAGAAVAAAVRRRALSLRDRAGSSGGGGPGRVHPLGHAGRARQSSWTTGTWATATWTTATWTTATWTTATWTATGRPDGIPLAEGAEDRDGLEMDVLHLPLGPVLRHWPAGVVLRLTLHGDVVADAEVTRLDARELSGRRRAHPRRPAPRRGRVGAGAGWAVGRGRGRAPAPRPVPGGRAGPARGARAAQQPPAPPAPPPPGAELVARWLERPWGP